MFEILTNRSNDVVNFEQPGPGSILTEGRFINPLRFLNSQRVTYRTLQKRVIFKPTEFYFFGMQEIKCVEPVYTM